jgi:hypothetical protein
LQRQQHGSKRLKSAPVGADDAMKQAGAAAGPDISPASLFRQDKLPQPRALKLRLASCLGRWF